MEDKQQHEQFDLAFTMLKAGVPPYLVGPSGAGKTELVLQLSRGLGLPFYYAGAVESAFQLRGFYDGQGRVVRTPFREAYEKGGVFLFDELDASSPAAIVSLHAALDNGVFDAPDGMVSKHKDFYYIGAANTWGNGATLDYVGRNPLDGATLDRYGFITMDYDEEFEAALVARQYPGQVHWTPIVQQARAVVRELKIRHIVSPRASLNGARLLRAGLSLHLVFQCMVLKGMSRDDVMKVTGKVDLTNKTLRETVKTLGVKNDRLADMIAQTQMLTRKVEKSVKTAEGLLADSERKINELKAAAAVAGEVSKAIGAANGSIDSANKTLKELARVRDFAETRARAVEAAIENIAAGKAGGVTEYKTVLGGVSPDTGKEMHVEKAERPLTMKWREAMDLAAGRNAHDPRGWRVPTEKEAEILSMNNAVLGIFNRAGLAEGWCWTSGRNGQQAVTWHFGEGKAGLNRIDNLSAVLLVCN